jgi:two-component sensor histidine kinase
MSAVLHLLQIEDSESDAALMVRLLEKAGYTVKALRVEEAEGLRAALAQQPWDVIICDYNLPQFDGPAALRLLRETGLDIPFIIVSGVIGEDVAVTMLKSGAHDYLRKNHLVRLAPAVAREIEDAKVRQDRRRAQGSLQEMVIELEAALTEKTVLLREVHHRVKNNLAVISSLLNMKAEATTSPEAKQALSESQQRVFSMALIHEQLYRSDHLDRVNFSAYAQQFVPTLSSACLGEPGRVSIEMDIDAIELGIEAAVPCALILNELLSNAFKHAFHGERSGKVRISFHEAGPDTLELAIEDDGIGLPAGLLEGRNTKSLGLQIVRILAKQLGGSLQQEPCPGAHLVLRFPANSARHAPPPKELTQSA